MKKFIKNICFIVVLGVILSVPLGISVKVNAEEALELNYEESTDTLTITGNGTLKKDELVKKIEELNTQRKDKKVSKAGHVVVEDGITKIGEKGLYSIDTISKIKTLKLPDSLEEIGECAFMGQYKLKELKIPQNVKKIGGYAFLSLTKIKKIELPASLEKCSSKLFIGCENLVEIKNNSSIFVTNAPGYDNYNMPGYWICNGKIINEDKYKEKIVIPPKSTARLRTEHFKIKYNLLGGKKTGKLPTSYTQKKSINIPSHVKRKGCIFAGWYLITKTDDYSRHKNISKISGYGCYGIPKRNWGNVTAYPIWVKLELSSPSKGVLKVKAEFAKDFKKDQVATLGMVQRLPNYVHTYYEFKRKETKYFRKLKSGKKYRIYVIVASDPDDYDSYWNDFKASEWYASKSCKVK